jgi:hypothetical protein
MSYGEKEIETVLKELGIQYKTQWRFPTCRNKYPLPFDFVVWSNRTIKAIEYQGKQHYRQTFKMSYWEFRDAQKRDDIKRAFCEERNIPLLEIPYWERTNIEQLVREFVK